MDIYVAQAFGVYPQGQLGVYATLAEAEIAAAGYLNTQIDCYHAVAIHRLVLGAEIDGTIPSKADSVVVSLDSGGVPAAYGFNRHGVTGNYHSKPSGHTAVHITP